MIREIRKLDGGRFEVVDENVDVFNVQRLRQLKDQLGAALVQAEKQLEMINSNLSKVSMALSEAKEVKK